MRIYPYTKRGLSRVPCAHCGAPSRHQWRMDICSFAKIGWFGVCPACDLALNRMVLRFLRAPNADQLIDAYGAERYG